MLERGLSFCPKTFEIFVKRIEDTGQVNSKLRFQRVQGHLGGSVGKAFDFGSDHDLMVHEFEPHIGLCTDSLEPAWDSLLSLCPSPACALSLSK